MQILVVEVTILTVRGNGGGFHSVYKSDSHMVKVM